ncbi:kunitz trypsin inhibitor 5-like [Lotus japonicus]|uniref:kunitz trypsin inhibitor 5-like n=1 Tax=Lotus japonicus TaxID=34305 RepID=UPI0025869DC6|nr:kunitz trypsin inhibitor 5-like [Lotus japonicus]
MATNSALLIVFFLCITLTIELKFSTGALLDIDGNHLNAASYYNILPLDWGKSLGGISVRVAAPDGTLSVVLEWSKTFAGLPVSFSNVTASSKVIERDDVVMISFVLTKNKNIFPWVLVYDELAKVWFFSTGSPIDYPGRQVKNGIFRISYANLGYKLVFCGDVNTSTCKDIGIYIDSAGNSRIAIDRPAMLVKFKKTRLF